MAHVVLCVLVIAALCKAATASGSESYSYNHQDKWGSYCQTGTYQSPVNIWTNDLSRNPDTINLAFEWNYWLSGVFHNNGHTVKFTPNQGQPAIHTRTHHGQWKLLQVHMHWGENDGIGSEHRINGEQASLEIHFVHEHTGHKAHAVVALMADAGSESSSSVFRFLSLKSVLQYNERINTVLPLNDFLPIDRSYYFYEGSLTTPGCDQLVQWFVLKDRITVPRSYLRQLRTVRKDTAGSLLRFNYRDPQPLLCRSVYEHDDPVVNNPMYC